MTLHRFLVRAFPGVDNSACNQSPPRACLAEGVLNHAHLHGIHNFSAHGNRADDYDHLSGL